MSEKTDSGTGVQNSNRFILPITPQTKVDVTQRTFMVFNIPEVCPKGRHGCKEYRRTGYCPHTLNKHGRYMKRRLERYNEYKASVLALAKKSGFELPAYGFSVYFYIPMPKRWTNEDRIMMHGQLHHRKPDWDNLYKALADSLVFNDELIAQISGAGKFWVNTKIGTKRSDPCGPGWIEILIGQPVYNPFNVQWIDQSQVISLRQTMDYKREVRSGKRQVKKRVKNLFKEKNRIV